MKPLPDPGPAAVCPLRCEGEPRFLGFRNKRRRYECPSCKLTFELMPKPAARPKAPANATPIPSDQRNDDAGTMVAPTDQRIVSPLLPKRGGKPA
jgi:hypothetical protein